MKFGSLSHLTRKSLLQQLKALITRHHALTAEVLHVLAEVDRRRLWAEAGYSSLYSFCIGELGLEEDAAFRRMRAARMVRRFPGILEMVADGRLHLSALVLLHPHLRPWNAADLLADSARKTKHEIRAMLAERFPRADVPTRITPTSAPPACEKTMVVSSETAVVPAAFQCEVAPEPPMIPANGCGSGTSSPTGLAPEPVGASRGDGVVRTGDPHPELAPAPVASHVQSRAHGSLAPLTPQRYAVQFTMDHEMHADLTRAFELLGACQSRDRVQHVFRRALRELVTKLEKRKCAATDRPRTPSSETRDSRHVPAHVRRQVRQRDGDRCTFVAANGRRCESRTNLEFDHVIPVAKGGRSTVENMRLLCRAHNQLEAEREFGEGFIHGIRARARGAVLGPVRPGLGMP